MSYEIYTVGASIFGSLIIAVTKPLLDLYREKKKSQVEALDVEKKAEGESEERDNKHELDVTQQAFELCKQLIQTLTKQVEQLSSDIRDMEKAHLKCQEENASLRADVKALRAEVEALSERLNATETKN